MWWKNAIKGLYKILLGSSMFCHIYGVLSERDTIYWYLIDIEETIVQSVIQTLVKKTSMDSSTRARGDVTLGTDTQH